MNEKKNYIGEVAKVLGISPKTVRWYEAQELLDEPARTESGYRIYTEKDVERLKFIRKAFAFGFSSKEVKDILEIRAHGEAPCDFVIELITAKIHGIRRQFEDLQLLDRELTSLRKQWQAKEKKESKPANVCSCIEESEEPTRRKQHG